MSLRLSPEVLDLIRITYGVSLLGTLLMSLPAGRWFFGSEKHGGYTQSSRWVDWFQGPCILPWVLGAWLASALSLILGWHSVAAGLVNLLLSRYFFIGLRWKGIFRGMGAPGFMTYWTGALVFFLEYARFYDPAGTLERTALLVFRADFALIMISAGLYKLTSGYARNHGMDYGLVNPFWGRWWKFYQKLPADHVWFRLLNHLGYLTELAAGILLLVPSLSMYGALLVLATFAFVVTQIRLGFLCEMVMIGALAYVQAGGPWDAWIRALLPPSHAVAPVSVSALLPVNTLLICLFWGYLVLLLPAHAGLYYNFLARRKLPGFLQKGLEAYTNFFGIIIWRVFTVDVVNFFIRIWQREPSGVLTLYSKPGAPEWSSRFRYAHVGEFVGLASIFTTLKYYPHQPERFRERLLRYARTVPCPKGGSLVFEYVGLSKENQGFAYNLLGFFEVDPQSGEIKETSFSREAEILVRSPHAASRVHEGVKPGSYAPA